jgi:hypothetical protein
VLFKNYKLNKNNNYLLPSIKKLKEGNKWLKNINKPHL